MSTTSIASYEEAVAGHEWRRARALQHRRGRLRQAPGRQARDDPRALRRDRPRGALGRAAGALEPLRERAARARRRQGRPRGDAAAADARDRGGVLRHLEVAARSCSRCRCSTATTASAIACRTRRPRCWSPTRPTRAASTRRSSSTCCCSTTSCWRPAPADVRARGHARRRPRAALLHVRHDRPGQGDRARAPVPARARGVHLLPRRPRRRALPRHGRVGVGGRHRAAARAVALRRRAARLPARGRLRPAQAARVPLHARGRERLHDADRDALDDGHRRMRARAIRRSSASSARPASR